MAKITYSDKVALNENPSIADINKVNASDINEIKSVVNTNDDTVLGIIASNVYSTSEVNTGKKWINNKPIYRKSIEFSNISAGTATTIATISNVEYFFVNSSMSYCTDGTGFYPIPKTHLSNANNQVDVRFTKSSGVVALGCGSSNTATSGVLTVEYTKTTD